MQGLSPAPVGGEQLAGQGCPALCTFPKEGCVPEAGPEQGEVWNLPSEAASSICLLDAQFSSSGSTNSHIWSHFSCLFY